MSYYHSRRNARKSSKYGSGGKSRRPLPLKYIPKRLTTKDAKRQRNMLNKSRKMYKSGKYYTRKKVRSFKTKTSRHIRTARKVYKMESIVPSKELSRKTGCSIASLKKIVNKGEGAYYSSGSRPNQTARSWGIARLASSITGGKSAAVDFSILDKGCSHTKKAFRFAKKARKKHGHGTRRIVRTRLW